MTKFKKNTLKLCPLFKKYLFPSKENFLIPSLTFYKDLKIPLNKHPMIFLIES